MTKEQYDGKGYYTDHYEITKEIVRRELKEYDKKHVDRHLESLEAVSRVECLVGDISSSKAHNVIQYMWLGLLSFLTFWKYR